MIIRGSVGMFISPNNEILLNAGSGSHINALICDPKKFGLSHDEIHAEYLKHGEPVGMEGKAREVLLRKVIGNGWIRLRRYRNQQWSVTVQQLDSQTMSRIEAWHRALLEGVAGIREADPYLPIVITELQVKEDAKVRHHHN